MNRSVLPKKTALIRTMLRPLSAKDRIATSWLWNLVYAMNAEPSSVRRALQTNTRISAPIVDVISLTNQRERAQPLSYLDTLKVSTSASWFSASVVIIASSCRESKITIGTTARPLRGSSAMPTNVTTRNSSALYKSYGLIGARTVWRLSSNVSVAVSSLERGRMTVSRSLRTSWRPIKKS